MTTVERIGANLRNWRQRRRLTQEQLGERIGADGSRVSKLETGQENPTIETIDKLIVALNVDASDLFAPRPEEIGDDGQPQHKPHSLLEALASYAEGEAPDWRRDVAEAITLLGRALVNGSAEAPARAPGETGRGAVADR